MNIENTIITKKKSNFWVENVDGDTVQVREKYVNEIISAVPDVEENEVAILLAVIELSRIVVGSSQKSARLNYGFAIRAIIQLLENYSIDILTEVFEDMKYIHIKEVLEGDNPIEKLELYM